MKIRSFCIVTLIGFLFVQTSLPQAEEEQETFANPVAEVGADPWVIRWQEEYLYCYSRQNRIWVSRTKDLLDIGKAEPVSVWTPPEGTLYSKHLWAPELHRLNDRWYIYVAADDGDNANHRMYVLEGESQNPQKPFEFKGKIADPADRWAIDGTVLPMDDGRLYFIWSGWEGFEDVQQDLYIAPMENPWTISGERVCISRPEHDWERIGRPTVNEGPEVLKRDGKIHIIYSASGSWTDDYCLGRLTWNGGDVLKPESWVKHPSPVFSRTADVFGPGHASFVKSPSGREDWIVYHSAKFSGAGWKRDVRMQPFGWNTDGSPDFGIPISAGESIPAPR